MVKIRMPLKSVRARGWFGRSFYATHGVVTNPYPIGRYGLPFNNSHYYSHIGWVYQVRRTWHGLQNVAARPSISEPPNTPAQLATKAALTAGAAVWSGMGDSLKDVYRRKASGKKYGGYNLFLSHYLTGKPI